MKLLTALGLTAAAVFVASKIVVAGNASRLNYQISTVGLSISGIQPVISFNLVVQNPTNGSFSIAAIVGNVFLNGSQIGNVSGFIPVTVPPTAQANVPLQAIINGTLLVSDVVNLLNGSAGISASIQVKGTVNANGLLLPLDVTYKIL